MYRRLEPNWALSTGYYHPLLVILYQAVQLRQAKLKREIQSQVEILLQLLPELFV